MKEVETSAGMSEKAPLILHVSRLLMWVSRGCKEAKIRFLDRNSEQTPPADLWGFSYEFGIAVIGSSGQQLAHRLLRLTTTTTANFGLYRSDKNGFKEAAELKTGLPGALGWGTAA